MTPPTISLSPNLVKNLVAAGQDHEFYPTTDEIIRCLAADIGTKYINRHENPPRGRKAHSFESVLDIGAGNGKVLLALRELTGLSELHAIEKSSLLCRQLPEDILIIGTDFHEQSLLSKQVDIIFCNPPYSEFEEWAVKIIRQSGAARLYLVLPVRWGNCVAIADALKFRAASARSLGNFTFQDAEDRQARANVHLLRIDLHVSEDKDGDDAFERFFKEQFADLINKFEESAPKAKMEAEDDGFKYGGTGRPGERHRPFHDLVPGPNYPEALVAIYRGEMDNIERNYQLVGQLDPAIMREFDISPDRVMACLKARLKGLKNDYWNELFSHLSAITDRLTSQSRQQLLDTLQRHCQVDFTVNNILEVVCWVIKNANKYIDSQLIVIYEKMVDKCNVHMYQSNKRVWQDQGWRYNNEPGHEKNSHFALDYRIVTHRLGGMSDQYGSIKISEEAMEFCGDLLTIARNLGFNRSNPNDSRLHYHGRDQWTPGQTEQFWFMDSKTNGRELLFDVRAFKNRNCHFRLNQDFILALNVEHGRLKGWLRTPAEAVEELADPKAARYFAGNAQIAMANPTLLLT